MILRVLRIIAVFQLTRPLRGATLHKNSFAPTSKISTHTPLAGRDMATAQGYLMIGDFNSHAPCGARLVRRMAEHFDGRFQLTRPLRGATNAERRAPRKRVISTHTPLAGRDHFDGRSAGDVRDFNSHAPCGARQEKNHRVLPGRKFQLTRPLRGATR